MALLAFLAAENGAGEPAGGADPSSDDFLTPEACRGCHQSVYDGYLQTSHAQAMRVVEPGLLDEQFREKNEYFYVKKDTANSAFFRLAITGAGNAMVSRLIGACTAESVSPVVVPRNPTAATMSPV